LQLEELGITPAPGEQFLVGSHRFHAPVAEHHDAVGWSRISTCASRMYARAITIFCHSPPDRSSPVLKRLPIIWS